MKTHALPLAIILCLCPTMARAQVRVGIDIGLPALPQLVVVSPGVQVVEGFQDEVFFQGGWYWCRRSDGWYRARSPQAHFDWIDERRVPRGLARNPPGHYRNWHHEGPGPGRGRGEAMGERDGGHRDRGQAMGERDGGHHREREMARSNRGEGHRNP